MACRVCGIDRVEIPEAAHIIADADGGPADSDNALLLCANHHIAMDAGLFTWDHDADGAAWRTGVASF